MAEIFGYPIMGGGGAGAMLTVTGVAGSTVTVSKDGKSYTRTLDSNGKATFGGLAAGTWTVKMTNGIATSTRTITITTEYELTMTYFTATINITYPAKSTCVIKNSSGAQVRSDTNTSENSRKWTTSVGEADTYTIIATATDGSGKTKSTTVSITTKGQVETVTLRYSVDIFREGEGVSSGYTIQGWFPNKNAYDSGLRVSNEKIIWATVTSVGNQIWVIPSIDVSEYSTLKIDFKCTNRYSSAQETVTIGIGPDLPTGEGTPGNFVAKTVVPYSTERAVRAVDLSGFTSTTKQYIKLSAHGITGEIYNIWFE